MNKNTSVIEINGNRYDAVSGQLIGAVKRVANQVKPAAGVVDGFIRRPSASKIAKPIIKPPGRERVAQNIARQPQKSQTLMRKAVTRYTQALVSSDNPQPKARSIGPKPGQILLAKTVAKNSKVNRFNKSFLSPRPTTKSAPSVGQVVARPTKPASSKSGGLVAANAQPLPSLVASASQRHIERLLDEALTRADSHREALRRQMAGNSPWGRIKLMPRWITIGASSLAVVLLAGFFVWQNIPQVSMRLAATQAHVSAVVPNYTPVGFSFAAPVSHGDKAVTIKFKSSNDTVQNFSITQKASNWDSTTLAASVATQSSQVQTSQVKGTTVYIYGSGNNAEWVDRGVLYTLGDQAGLSSDQILKIAGSM